MFYTLQDLCSLASCVIFNRQIHVNVYKSYCDERVRRVYDSVIEYGPHLNDVISQGSPGVHRGRSLRSVSHLALVTAAKVL